MNKNKLQSNHIAVFTNLEWLATEIVSGAGVSKEEIVDFFELIDTEMGDSVFTDMVRERFKDL